MGTHSRAIAIRHAYACSRKADISFIPCSGSTTLVGQKAVMHLQKALEHKEK